MSLGIKSNNYGSTFAGGNISEVEVDTTNCERNGNLLKHVQLHYRNVVKGEVSILKQMLSDSKYFEIKKKLDPGFNSFPQVMDELIMTRLDKCLKAVQEISPGRDGMKAVLVIERAMQVIGESIEPPSYSNKGSIVSFLLRSCLPANLQEEFIRIRNDLSHYRSNSISKKLKIEKKVVYFKEIKNELERIQKSFEIVEFIQRLRLQELMMSDCLKELRYNMDSNVYEAFKRDYEHCLDERKLNYGNHHQKCIELLLKSLSDLREHSLDVEMEQLFGQLKSIEYLFEFIVKNKNEECLDNLFKRVQHFYKTNKVKYENEKIKNKKIKYDFHPDLDKFLLECQGEIMKRNHKKDAILLAPAIKSFFKSLKQNMFSEEEREKIYGTAEAILRKVVEAKNDLVDIFKEEIKMKTDLAEVESLLQKVLLPHDKLVKIVCYYKNRKSDKASEYLKRCVQEDNIMENIKQMLENGSLQSGYATTFLTKIVFQRNSETKCYHKSSELSENIYKKLERFFTKKINFLLDRMEIMKNILIDNDTKIKETWNWGRHEIINHHLKFLSTQRYIKDQTISSSLEMAYFDCLSTFYRPLKNRDEERDDSDKSLETLYEKSSQLFAGYDLRILIAHRNNFPEAIGQILNEDDIPSEIIEKILELINDANAIKAILKLFKTSGVIEQETFVKKVKNSEFSDLELIKTIKRCEWWERYIRLFPFL